LKTIGVLLELAGLAGLSYGLWLAWVPLGFIAAGACLVLVGFAAGGGKT